MSEWGKLGKTLHLALVHSAFRPRLLRGRPYWGIQAFRRECNEFPAPMCDLAAGLDLNFVPPVSAPLLTVDIPFAARSLWARVTGILQDLLEESWRPDEAAGWDLNTQWLGSAPFWD